jgi:hypothetical protein
MQVDKSVLPEEGTPLTKSALPLQYQDLSPFKKSIINFFTHYQATLVTNTNNI